MDAFAIFRRTLNYAYDHGEVSVEEWDAATAWLTAQHLQLNRDTAFDWARDQVKQGDGNGKS